MTNETDVVVVGAGPAGLAAAACLRREGIPHLLLDRDQWLAPAWRRHYDRLHLHTSRGFSGLPYWPMPKSYPRYPSRAQVVEYLESYAHHLGLEPHVGVEVTSIRKEGPRWTVESTAGTIRCEAVVVATGANGEPVSPTWPGLETFPGPVVHSSSYRNGRDFENLDVLVVGFGNSGGEIALDLLEHGARPTMSVRGPVNVIPRDVLGIPVLAIAIPLSRLPPGIADALIWPLLKLYYPSYARLGLRKAERGPFRQIAEANRVPLLDIGTIREIREGRIRVEPGIAFIDGPAVTFEHEGSARFDALVLATGYEPALPIGVRPDRAQATGDTAGLHFCGFYVSPRGMLREIAREARDIVARIATERKAKHPV